MTYAILTAWCRIRSAFGGSAAREAGAFGTHASSVTPPTVEPATKILKCAESRRPPLQRLRDLRKSTQDDGGYPACHALSSARFSVAPSRVNSGVSFPGTLSSMFEILPFWQTGSRYRKGLSSRVQRAPRESVPLPGFRGWVHERSAAYRVPDNTVIPATSSAYRCTLASSSPSILSPPP
jgi:hypothetical protein